MSADVRFAAWIPTTRAAESTSFSWFSSTDAIADRVDEIEQRAMAWRCVWAFCVTSTMRA
jgi:hypothetical protein